MPKDFIVPAIVSLCYYITLCREQSSLAILPAPVPRSRCRSPERIFIYLLLLPGKLKFSLLRGRPLPLHCSLVWRTSFPVIKSRVGRTVSPPRILLKVTEYKLRVLLLSLCSLISPTPRGGCGSNTPIHPSDFNKVESPRQCYLTSLRPTCTI